MKKGRQDRIAETLTAVKSENDTTCSHKISVNKMVTPL